MENRKATFRLHALIMEGVSISWEVPHARERAEERDVPLFEAERIVRRGTVVKIETIGTDEVRWRVAGCDSDDRPIEVVVRPVRDKKLVVITVIRTDQ